MAYYALEAWRQKKRAARGLHPPALEIIARIVFFTITNAGRWREFGVVLPSHALCLGGIMASSQRNDGGDDDGDAFEA